MFGQLQYALNRVWRVKAAPHVALIVSFIKQRILSFALVLSVGFLLMVSLVISAVLGTLHTYLDDAARRGCVLLERARIWSISFTLATVLIAMMFKYLPDAEIEWRDTWLGSLITAALFIVGKQVIGLYLGQTTVASSFGAAASVVIFMIWVYYAALILLFGAEITQAVAARRGAIVVPTENAEAAPGPPVPGSGSVKRARRLRDDDCGWSCGVDGDAGLVGFKRLTSRVGNRAARRGVDRRLPEPDAPITTMLHQSPSNLRSVLASFAGLPPTLRQPLVELRFECRFVRERAVYDRCDSRRERLGRALPRGHVFAANGSQDELAEPIDPPLLHGRAVLRCRERR